MKIVPQPKVKIAGRTWYPAIHYNLDELPGTRAPGVGWGTYVCLRDGSVWAYGYVDGGPAWIAMTDVERKPSAKPVLAKPQGKHGKD